METIVRLAFLPFVIAAGVNVARILIAMQPGLFLHSLMQHFVLFENFPVVIAALGAAGDAVIGRSAGLSAGVAIAICRSSQVSVHKSANIAAAFLILRLVMILLQVFHFKSAAQLARWSCIVCVAGLFGLVATPDSNWLAIVLSKPDFL